MLKMEEKIKIKRLTLKKCGKMKVLHTYNFEKLHAYIFLRGVLAIFFPQYSLLLIENYVFHYLGNETMVRLIQSASIIKLITSNLLNSTKLK